MSHRLENEKCSSCRFRGQGAGDPGPKGEKGDPGEKGDAAPVPVGPISKFDIVVIFES